METEFQVERRSFSTAQATCDAIPSVDPIRQENRGQLLSDFHQFLGDDAEPDTLFLWKAGLSASLKRLRTPGKDSGESQIASNRAACSASSLILDPSST